VELNKTKKNSPYIPERTKRREVVGEGREKAKRGPGGTGEGEWVMGGYACPGRRPYCEKISK